jgi:hypothetical protein
MSRKFKKLVRSVSESSGVSHAGAVNLLRRGSSASLRPLDPVLIRSGAEPVFGEHTHEAGLVSAVLQDGSVVVTPACPRMTLGGVSFYKHEKIARYRAEDVRPYRLKKGERFARFVESVFDEVPYDPATAYAHDDIPWLFKKPAGVPAFVIGEDGDSILMVSRGLVSIPDDGKSSNKVAIPMWVCEADLVHDGVIVGTDAVKTMRAVRERMVALIDSASFDDVGLPPYEIPEDCGWVIDNIDDTMGRDLGLVMDPSVVRKCGFLRGRYACGTGKIGRYLMVAESRGVLLLRSDVTVVHLRGPSSA